MTNSEGNSLWSRWKELLREEWAWWQQAARAQVHLDESRCTGCWTCYEVCPVTCFRPERQVGQVRLTRPEHCVACGACSLQCPAQAVTLEL